MAALGSCLVDADGREESGTGMSLVRCDWWVEGRVALGGSLAAGEMVAAWGVREFCWGDVRFFFFCCWVVEGRGLRRMRAMLMSRLEMRSLSPVLAMEMHEAAELVPRKSWGESDNEDE